MINNTKPFRAVNTGSAHPTSNAEDEDEFVGMSESSGDDDDGDAAAQRGASGTEAAAATSPPSNAPVFEHNDVISHDVVDRSFAAWLLSIAAAGGTRCDGLPLPSGSAAAQKRSALAALATVRVMGIADVPELGSRLRIHPSSGVVVEVRADTVSARDDDAAISALAQLSGSTDTGSNAAHIRHKAKKGTSVLFCLVVSVAFLSLSLFFHFTLFHHSPSLPLSLCLLSLSLSLHTHSESLREALATTGRRRAADARRAAR